MKNNEKYIKAYLIEKIMYDIRTNVKLDNLLLLHNMSSCHSLTDIELNDEYDETEVLFSLIDYIIHMDMNDNELYAAIISNGMRVKVSKGKTINDLTFLCNEPPSKAYMIDFEFLKS